MALAGQAETYVDLPMAGRTYGQVAAPTSWGAVVAGFGAPLLDALAALPALRDTSLNVSLTGAVGTGAALGLKAPETRRALAEALGLNDPGRSWHTDRGPILAITDWQGRVMSALSHMAETLIALIGTDRSEIALGSVGGSSTMPQKQNPVGPSAVRALHHLFGGLRTTLHSASVHRDQRDGAAWFAEWMVVPQLTLSVAAALNETKDIAAQMKPQPEVMAKALELGGGAVFAEALSFALTQKMTRTAAQSEAKRIAQQAKSDGGSLQSIALQAHPDLPSTLFDPSQNLGQAPHDARAFADRVRSGCA
ncbi:MAG: lyase family protein [Pseudomonadota bacterium]